MSVITGFQSNGGTPFLYLQDSNNASVAAGLDSAGSDVFKISVSTSINAVPTTSPQLLIDPAANGNITLTPNGTGKIVASYMAAGVVQSSSAGLLTSSNGTNGQVLIGGGTAPAWATITAGSGVTITNGANSITIAASGGGGGGIQTITGNDSVAVSPDGGGNLNILTANTTVRFTNEASNTETLDFGIDVFGNANLMLGSLPSITSGMNNVSLGIGALAAVVDGYDNVAIGTNCAAQSVSDSTNTMIGYNAAYFLNGGISNTLVGTAAGFNLTTGSYNTIIGYGAGTQSEVQSGSYNLLLGAAGTNYGAAESYNIMLNSNGRSNESSILRIGDTTGGADAYNYLNADYIFCISNVNVGSVATVVTEHLNQLGTAVITAGTGITVTPGANTITIASTGSGVATITGNTGGAISPSGGTINIETANANIGFAGSGHTETLDFIGDGSGNLSLGASLSALAGGTNNTGFGSTALAGITTGGYNAAFGQQALSAATTSNFNTALGQAALANVVGGSGHNVAVGNSSGGSLNSGAYNTYVGFEAGSSHTTSESSNIIIGTGGTGNEATGQSNKLVIGSGTGTGNYQLNAAYIAGIQLAVVTGTAVLVSTGDQLGVAASSARFKNDIRDMDDSSATIYKLRPVTFTWNKSSTPGLADAPTDMQYGLIAEEVAQTMPHLVTVDKDSQPFSVAYERLIPMLLNEIQRLEKRVTMLERENHGN